MSTEPFTTQEHPLHAGGFDFRVRSYTPTAPSGIGLVWCHGGGFVFGDLEMAEAHLTAQELASRGVTVVSVDYTLAPSAVVAKLPPRPMGDRTPTPEQMIAALDAMGPRSPFPTASLQVLEAFDWARANSALLGTDPSLIAVGGASAGGALAASVAMRLRDRGGAQPLGALLVYAPVHAELPPPPPELAALIDGLPPELTFPPAMARALNENYLGGASPSDPYAFPGGHDVAGFPASLVISAERDRLRTSSELFADELARAGVHVETELEAGALHGFLNTPERPEQQRTITRIHDFLAERASEVREG